MGIQRFAAGIEDGEAYFYAYKEGGGGDYVRYAAHLAAITAKDEEIRELREALQKIEHLTDIDHSNPTLRLVYEQARAALRKDRV